MIKIKCEYKDLKPIGELKNHPKNMNKHSDAQIDRLAQIIEYQGFRHPIIVSNLSGYIVVGHGRLEAARKLGMDEVPVDYQDFKNEDQEYSFIVSDNSIAEWSELDLKMIEDEVKNLEDDFDIDLLGLKDFELSDVNGIAPGDEDEVPDVPKEPVSKPGDLYLLGDHRLLCGDSTNIQHVERLMGGEKADMVFTDPPYGVGYEYNSHKDETDKEKHMRFLADLISMATTLSDRFILTPGCYNLDAITLKPEPTHIGCWTKTNAMSPGRVTHFWTWEPILFYGKWKRKRGNDVFNFPVGRQPDTGDHTCPKPIALWQEIVENFSEAKESILDLFGGSGSTLIACEKTNRKCFMMELDPHYIDVIVTRWCKYTGKNKVIRNGEEIEWADENLS